MKLDPDDANDIASEVFYDLARGKHAMREAGSVRFIRALVQRHASDLVHSRQRSSEAVSQFFTDPSIGALIERAALDDTVAETLDQEALLRILSEQDRAILSLAFSEGLTQAQIAEKLGLTQATVSRRINSARQNFRSAYGFYITYGVSGEAPGSGGVSDESALTTRIAELADAVWGPKMAAVWLRSPNGFLDGERPANLIATNETTQLRRVIESLEATLEDAFA